MVYDVLKTRHIKEVFIPVGHNNYRYLKFSKNICLSDIIVSYSYYKDKVIQFRGNKNVVQLKKNYHELRI